MLVVVVAGLYELQNYAKYMNTTNIRLSAFIGQTLDGGWEWVVKYNEHTNGAPIYLSTYPFSQAYCLRIMHCTVASTAAAAWHNAVRCCCCECGRWGWRGGLMVVMVAVSMHGMYVCSCRHIESVSTNFLNCCSFADLCLLRMRNAWQCVRVYVCVCVHTTTTT